MESSIVVIFLFMCVARFTETSAKIDIIGNTENSGIDSETNDLHLDANQLSNEIDNCREACLQKVSSMFFFSLSLSFFFFNFLKIIHIKSHRMNI